MSAMSLRRIEREIGLSRVWLGKAVRRGDLPAVRRGPALLVNLDDLRAWWKVNEAPWLRSADKARP